MSLDSGSTRDSRAREAFEEAVNLDLSVSDVSVCLVAVEKNGDIETQRFETSPELAGDFRGFLANFCQDAVENQKEPREYAANQVPNDQCVQFVSLEQYPEIKERYKGASQPGTLTKFTTDPAFISKIGYYAVVAQVDDETTLVGLRSMEVVQKPVKSRWLLKAIFDEINDRYRRLEDDPFLFDNQIDCVVYKDFVFIANRYKFEKIFNFDQVTREMATRVLARLEAFDIENFDAFKAACLRDKRKHRMLAPIDKPGADLSYIAVDRARLVINTNPQLSSIVSRVNGSEVLTYDESRKWDLLRFLRQSTVRSVASDSAFEVEGDMRQL